jgi:hypothetical protein
MPTMASSATRYGLPEQHPDLRLVIDSAPALIHTALPATLIFSTKPG